MRIRVFVNRHTKKQDSMSDSALPVVNHFIDGAEYVSTSGRTAS
ncbi:MAG: hypothetical protein JWQ64_3335, partial [Subtercola sp.]|nr:hypothetical protein [Subtercola sp.]